MRCPYCRTENRDERESCYYCQKDLTMLRVIINKAKTHFNTALELAERDRNEEAIAELHNALDLDYSHVNSHVVLGTLYAKVGDLEKAEKCWRDALTIDPRYEKAHEYLNKVRSVRENLPIVQRQRILILFMAIVLAGLLAVFSVTLFGESRHKVFQEAWSAYENHDYTEALELLQRAGQSPSATLARQAQTLSSIIQRQMELSLENVRLDIKQKQFAHGQNTLNSLREQQPPSYVRSKIQSLEQELRQTVRAEVENSLEAYKRQEVSRKTVEERIRLYSALFPEPAARENIAQAEDRLSSISQGLALQSLERQIQKGITEDLEGLKQLAALSKQWGEQPILQSRMETLAAQLQQKYSVWFQEALEAADQAKAREALQKMGQLQKLVPQAKRETRLRELESQWQQDKLRRQEEKLAQALKSESYAQALETLEELLANPALPQDERDLYAVQVDKVRRKLAVQRWLWMHEREGDYMNGRLSFEDGRKTLQIYPQVLEDLPQNVYPNMEDNILLFVALAHRQLGQKAEARKILKRLEQDYPESDVKYWIRRFLAEK